MTDTRPPVPPVEGHYALLRNGEAVGPMRKEYQEQDWFIVDIVNSSNGVEWCSGGNFMPGGEPHDFDIIATISPEDMQAVASGELARLRAARCYPLVHSLPAIGETIAEMRANVDRNSKAFAQGDMILRWVNEGSIIMHEFASSNASAQEPKP